MTSRAERDRFVNRTGLRWRDAPAACGPHETLYNRWVRWSRMGVFAQMLTELAQESQATDTLMIDATRRIPQHVIQGNVIDAGRASVARER
jgi:transposase